MLGWVSHCCFFCTERKNSGSDYALLWLHHTMKAAVTFLLLLSVATHAEHRGKSAYSQNPCTAVAEMDLLPCTK